MSCSASLAIIGAGIAGASAARSLSACGLSVVVFDKSGAPGGRAATRTRDGAHFDHGAQYFTARDPSFVAQLDAWRDRGLVAQWPARLMAIDDAGVCDAVGTDEPRWVAVPGMRSLAIDLLAGVECRLGQQIVHTERLGDGWWLRSADGARFGPYVGVLATLPAPQAAALFCNERVGQQAGLVRFAPCWALMMSFDAPLALEFDGAFINAGPLSWIARDSSKPGRPVGERWLAHATPAFSEEYLNADAHWVATSMAQAFRSATGYAGPAPRFQVAHRWRYALAQPPLYCAALSDPERRIALGGDWCHGSRIEGAWLSGTALAATAAQWVKHR